MGCEDGNAIGLENKIQLKGRRMAKIETAKSKQDEDLFSLSPNHIYNLILR